MHSSSVGATIANRSSTTEKSSGGSYRPSIFASDSDEDEQERAKAEKSEQLEKEANNKKKRNLDTFLEELKRGQEQREQGRERSVRSNRANIDDGETTNLYIVNLDPEVDEQALCMAFAKHGPIGSVKIMWPRTTEEHARKLNSGFVCFMDRASAAKALDAMDRTVLNKHELQVSWGKRVQLPDRPIFELDMESSEQRLPPTGHPFNARLPRLGYSSDIGGTQSESNISEVHVSRPAEPQLVQLIHWTVEQVIKHGPEFECLLIARKTEDPRFRFLSDYLSPEHVYYRWRMYSLLNQDTKAHWHAQMFFMYDKGPIWIPPPKVDTSRLLHGQHPTASAPVVDEIDEDQAYAASLHKGLDRRARKNLEHRVRKVRELARGPIAAAMSSAIEHAYAAEDVVDVVCQSLIGEESATPKEKLAKLLLVSDILHNCSAPIANAWRLRDAFEPQLRRVFDSLTTAYQRIDGRLRAEEFRRRVLGVLAVWDAWMMFPKETIHELAASFFQT
ncbi:hypothetical protein COEREDRAFT_96449 [Coemansia reversa NRRL 1564]|uniref:U2 snRNP-associated SURP motif-containing protein n=1 Tax=Coemansia reversa (strain ATCC 12441 / NRRL 1564) TaxID=763665 RepID=A0A2G5BFU3_COERN|nr:hypothetical protein COEREDRAFT_96449 [Coemansia reversa NRRL 1564]|eukprot:PIA17898.1 hypothetical protein COEREDRAFT_96449 [Coemansia reversa NRRL 1564]